MKTDILDCKIIYEGHSGGWGECTPGSIKRYTCTGCVSCTKPCVDFVDWCNDNGNWVHARKILKCLGNFLFSIIFLVSN